MPPLPRLALATAHTDLEPSLATLALLGALTELGWRVQHFRAWASPLNTQLIGPITGLPGRHLDPWLMPPELCRAVFVRGARGLDLSIVEGALGREPSGFEPELAECPWRALSHGHGDLRPLAETLDLPIVGLVDCRGWREPHLPFIPPDFDAVILDGVADSAHFHTLRSMVRLLTGKPVLGGLEDLPTVRSMLEELPLGRHIPQDCVDRLTRGFLRYADLDAIRAVAESRPDPCFECCDDLALSCRDLSPRHVRVAYAMDEAFGDYFPDTLETLELLGAELVEFSPLRDEALPHDIGLVMIGCGFPDRFADELSANHSLIAALRSHVCHRGRIYAEGGGAAYLGRSMIVEGRRIPGADILPFDAELQTRLTWPYPVERTLLCDGWLGAAGTSVRGYRSGRWELHPAPDPTDCPARSGRVTAEHDIVFRYNAIGSLIHLHLGALPDVVAAFVGKNPREIAGQRRLIWGM